MNFKKDLIDRLWLLVDSMPTIHKYSLKQIREINGGESYEITSTRYKKDELNTTALQEIKLCVKNIIETKAWFKAVGIKIKQFRPDAQVLEFDQIYDFAMDLYLNNIPREKVEKIVNKEFLMLLN